MAKYRTPRSIRNRRRQRRDLAFRRTRKYNWQKPLRRRRKRTRYSILDLLFLPPFLIMDELIERCRDLLNVK